MGREGPVGTTGSYFSLIKRQLRGLCFIPEPWKQPLEGHQSQDREETRASHLARDVDLGPPLHGGRDTRQGDRVPDPSFPLIKLSSPRW